MREHRKKSPRAPGYDYSLPGGYFITTCAQGRALLFESTQARAAVESAWTGLTDIFGNIELDEFVVMPTHSHGIIKIIGDGAYRLLPGTWADTRRGEQIGNDAYRLHPDTWQNSCRGEQLLAPTGWQAKYVILGNIVGAFKTSAASAINALRGCPGATVWQRNYYEHVIRNDQEWNAIRHYIRENPAQWATDRENPASPTAGKGGSFEEGLESGFPT